MIVTNLFNKPIKVRIEALDDYSKSYLGKTIELMLLIIVNYNHIQDLEQLRDLIHNYYNAYYNENYPLIAEALNIANDIALTHFSRAYETKETEPRWRTSPDYLLQNVIPLYFPNKAKYNKHWKNLEIHELIEYID